jgi:hypothetical protein
MFDLFKQILSEFSLVRIQFYLSQALGKWVSTKDCYVVRIQFYLSRASGKWVSTKDCYVVRIQFYLFRASGKWVSTKDCYVVRTQFYFFRASGKWVGTKDCYGNYCSFNTYLTQVKELKNSESTVSTSFNIIFLFNILL